MTLSLRTGWTVRAVGGPVPEGIAGRDIPATVPGCVHLDLEAAGLIPDPLVDQNEVLAQWVGRADWRYHTRFGWPGPVGESAEDGDHEVDLVAAGLDTIAVVELNGHRVAETSNMHRSHRIPVRPYLSVGDNDLTVMFRSPVAAAQQASLLQGWRPATVPHPINALRKMACNFGADWGPELPTAGIWRAIGLESWRVARIAAVRPLVDVDGTTGRLSAHVEVQRSPGHDGPLDLEVTVAGRSARATVDAVDAHTLVEVDVPDVRLWWPRTHGGQPLYDVDVMLRSAEGLVDRWSGRVGFRIIRIETTPDDQGTPFTVHVNGQPVFARGVNWIPDDPFPSRVTPDRYRERLGQARDLNANMVRVWGGGVYEDDTFYEVCDELGLLVWQDFLFNCACYAEEEPLRGEILAEAREVVTRLSAHPSVALYNGCNENLWGYLDWGWQPLLGDLSWGAGYYFDLLPALVAELDPTRPYLPGSPYSMSQERHPLDPAHGTMHIWDVWNTRDYTAYREYVPRFCSEFGWQGPPTWSTLTRAVHDRPLTPDSPGMIAHERAVDGLGKLRRGLSPHLDEPDDVDGWHWAMSLNQARAITMGVEHFRSWMPTCMGSLVWQLNDCWPVISWSAVDGYDRRKPMWYALRRSYQDRLVTVQPRSGRLAVVLVNDSPEPWATTLRVTRHRVDGSVVQRQEVPVEAGSRSAVTIAIDDDLARPDDPAGELLVAEADDQRGFWFFVEDREGRLPEPRLDVRVTDADGGYRVAVTAQSLVRDLALLVDRLDPEAVVDEMLVTLLPGESVDWFVRSAAPMTREQVADPLALRCANQLVRR